jgi:hypothetical protein
VCVCVCVCIKVAHIVLYLYKRKDGIIEFIYPSFTNFKKLFFTLKQSKNIQN